MANKIYNVLNELFDTDCIYDIELFKDILSQWYTEIVGNIDFSGESLKSLAEFSKYKYKVIWTFDVSYTQLESFDWFPVAAKHLVCIWNNIKSIDWIPLFDYCKLDNRFNYLEEVVKDLVYKYWAEYFLIDTKNHRLTNVEHLQRLDSIRPDSSQEILESFDYDIREYWDLLNKVRSTSGVIDIGKVIKVNDKVYAKEALEPEYYKNWWELDFLEVKEINWWLIKLKWKIYNKKLSKLL